MTKNHWINLEKKFDARQARNKLGTNHWEYKETQQSNRQESSDEAAGKLHTGNRSLGDLA